MINMNDLAEFQHQQVLEWDLSSLFLYKNQVLMLKSASSILFYHIETKEIDKSLLKSNNTLKFRKFFELNIPGFVHYTPGSEKFQVATDAHVFFYEFEDA